MKSIKTKTIDMNNYCSQLVRQNKTVEETFNKILEINPDYIKLIINDIEYLLNKYRYDEMTFYCNKLLEIDSIDSEILLRTSKCFESIQEIEIAIKHLDKIIEFDDTNKKAFLQKGNILHNNSQSEKALDCFNKALEICPTFEEALYSKAFVLTKMDDYIGAISCYDILLNKNPVDLTALNCKGTCLLKPIEDGIKDIINRNISFVKSIIDLIGDSKNCFDIILDINPNDSMAAKKREKLEDQRNDLIFGHGLTEFYQIQRD